MPQKKKGIRISLWFNPSNDSSLKYREKDADVLINQYKKYGILMWNIDGVQVTGKRGETNYRKILDKVEASTNFEAVFNIDITAGRRFGYNFLNTYGNFYMENRYTDGTNYYPYATLPNLWQFSAYIPPPRLQLEFLNKRRNSTKYPPVIC
jgi:alpha-galactosidase